MSELLTIAGDSVVLFLSLIALKMVNDNNTSCRDFMVQMNRDYLEQIVELTKVIKSE